MAHRQEYRELSTVLHSFLPLRETSLALLLRYRLHLQPELYQSIQTPTSRAELDDLKLHHPGLVQQLQQPVSNENPGTPLYGHYHRMQGEANFHRLYLRCSDHCLRYDEDDSDVINALVFGKIMSQSEDGLKAQENDSLFMEVVLTLNDIFS